MIFADIDPVDRDRLEEILRHHGVPLSDEISSVRRWSMACPALPTCGLAVTESERVLPSIIDALEGELAELGLADEVFTTRMTGCPNGCARPYNADIALVGKSKDRYTIYVGGRVLGDRLNFVLADKVVTEQIVATLLPVLEAFKSHRENGESFGDFCWRKRKNCRGISGPAPRPLCSDRATRTVGTLASDSPGRCFETEQRRNKNVYSIFGSPGLG